MFWEKKKKKRFCVAFNSSAVKIKLELDFLLEWRKLWFQPYLQRVKLLPLAVVSLVVES